MTLKYLRFVLLFFVLSTVAITRGLTSAHAQDACSFSPNSCLTVQLFNGNGAAISRVTAEIWYDIWVNGKIIDQKEIVPFGTTNHEGKVRNVLTKGGGTLLLSHPCYRFSPTALERGAVGLGPKTLTINSWSQSAAQEQECLARNNLPAPVIPDNSNTVPPTPVTPPGPPMATVQLYMKALDANGPPNDGGEFSVYMNSQWSTLATMNGSVAFTAPIGSKILTFAKYRNLMSETATITVLSNGAVEVLYLLPQGLPNEVLLFLNRYVKNIPAVAEWADPIKTQGFARTGAQIAGGVYSRLFSDAQFIGGFGARVYGRPMTQVEITRITKACTSLEYYGWRWVGGRLVKYRLPAPVPGVFDKACAANEIFGLGTDAVARAATARSQAALAYEIYLGRPAEEGAAERWAASLNSQWPDPAGWLENGLLIPIAASGEFVARAGNTPIGFLYRLFLACYGRRPTLGELASNLNYWTGRLGPHFHEQEPNRRTVATAFITSDEALRTRAALLLTQLDGSQNSESSRYRTPN